MDGPGGLGGGTGGPRGTALIQDRRPPREVRQDGSLLGELDQTSQHGVLGKEDCVVGRSVGAEIDGWMDGFMVLWIN